MRQRNRTLVVSCDLLNGSSVLLLVALYAWEVDLHLALRGDSG